MCRHTTLCIGGLVRIVGAVAAFSNTCNSHYYSRIVARASTEMLDNPAESSCTARGRIHVPGLVDVESD